MVGLSATVPSGEARSWQFRTAGELKLGLAGSVTPYTLDIETKGRGQAEPAYSRIKPLDDFGIIDVPDTREHTYETGEIEESVRVTVTNTSSESASYEGWVSPDGRQEYFVEDGKMWVYAGRSRLPVHSDVRDVSNPVDGMQVQVDGTIQQPAGTWWRHDGKWYSGDRLKFTVPDDSLGGNSNNVFSDFGMPVDMEIDIWQAHISVIDGNSEDVYLDLYDVTDDDVLFEHGYANNGNVVEFGNPIDVLSAPDENTIRTRSRNDTGGSVDFSGWIVWSFQSTLV